jgi:hypothetical protein
MMPSLGTLTSPRCGQMVRNNESSAQMLDRGFPVNLNSRLVSKLLVMQSIESNKESTNGSTLSLKDALNWVSSIIA